MLYYLAHLVGENKGMLITKVTRLLGLSLKKRMVSLIISQVLLMIGTSLWY